MSLGKFLNNGAELVGKQIGKAAVLGSFLLGGLTAQASHEGNPAATKDTVPTTKTYTQVQRQGAARSPRATNKNNVRTDSKDFWAFSVGYVNKGERPLYTPIGLYWEGVMPGFYDKPEGPWRRYTGFRAGINLIKEAEFGFNARITVPGVVRQTISARKTFSEGYADIMARYPIGNGNSPVQVQPFAYAGVGAGIFGANITNGTVTHTRTGFGVMAKAGFNANHVGFGLFGSAEIGQEYRQKNTIVGNYLPQNEAYGGRGKSIPQFKIGAYAIF